MKRRAPAGDSRQPASRWRRRRAGRLERARAERGDGERRDPDAEIRAAPGVGKPTIVKAILRIHGSKDTGLLLCALMDV